MNERPSDSSGLPLRAMVMVLLFLGVVFLLVGFQAMGSGDDSSADDSPVPASTTSTPSSSATAAPAAKADVRVDAVTYLHEWRRAGLSDHSPLFAVVGWEDATASSATDA